MPASDDLTLLFLIRSNEVFKKVIPTKQTLAEEQKKKKSVERESGVRGQRGRGCKYETDHVRWVPPRRPGWPAIILI